MEAQIYIMTHTHKKYIGSYIGVNSVLVEKESKTWPCILPKHVISPAVVPMSWLSRMII